MRWLAVSMMHVLLARETNPTLTHRRRARQDAHVAEPEKEKAADEVDEYHRQQAHGEDHRPERVEESHDGQE